MNHERYARPYFGNEPPLVADRRRRPDRRQVSARWLAGTLLTGLTSTTLMGIALSAAHEGGRDLVAAATISAVVSPAAETVDKGERVFATAVPVSRSRMTLEISTKVRDGARDVIRTVPFAYASMLLGARYPAGAPYPKFDATQVFSAAAEEADAPADGAAGELYAGKVEPDVSLTVEPFDFTQAGFDPFDDIGASEAEFLVRDASPKLDVAPLQVAAFRTLDPTRLDVESDAQDYEPGSAFRVIQENVSTSPSESAAERVARYYEEIIPFRQTRTIADALKESGHPEGEANVVGLVMSRLLASDTLDPGEVLRLGIEVEAQGPRIVRASVYQGETHRATVALGDEGVFHPAAEPVVSRSVAEAFDESATEAPMRSDMPTVYDGIYQAALSYGLDERLCSQLIKMLASDVDFQSRLEPSDRLTLLYSLEDGKETASAASDILFVEAKFGDTTKRYYRFRTSDDGHVDSYDEEGRSSKQFLLRNPVPKGRFTSTFGARRHPLLGYVRMHWGVDWSAPRGTPILASGSGTVEQADWATGFGRQTIIRHANGYETSYSHQSAIAKGVVKGAHVRQGQVIGYVGSTGLSTGNHLHYEVIVNGKKVDPMRIRLPSGRALSGKQLELFEVERQRIDSILKQGQDDTRVAGR